MAPSNIPRWEDQEVQEDQEDQEEQEAVVGDWPSPVAPMNIPLWSYSERTFWRTELEASQASPSNVLLHSRDSSIAQSPSHIHIPSPHTATSNDQEDDLTPSFLRE